MKSIAKYNPCKSCLCMRCMSLACPYEHFYNCYPNNAGCIRCMFTDNDKPVLECEHFQIRRRGEFYKIRVKRKDPYYRLATFLKLLHNEIKSIL